MEKILLTAAALVALGLHEEADATAVSAAIVKLHQDKAAADARAQAYEQAEKDRKTNEATAKVDLAIAEGRTTADNRAELIQLAIDKPALFDKLVGSKPEKVSLASVVKTITGTSTVPADRANWTLLKWMKEDQAGLDKIKKDDPDAYAKIKEVRN